jgi:hypothetical protein
VSDYADGFEQNDNEGLRWRELDDGDPLPTSSVVSACDYANSHSRKQKRCQPYDALTATSCGRTLSLHLLGRDLGR